jgi:hypothetical protein
MNRRRGAWVRASVALAAPACGAEATAAEPDRPARLALSWAAPTACIEAAALAALIERTLGRTVFVDADAADARLKGTIRAQGRGFRVHLEVRADDAGPLLATRDLDVEATSCSKPRPRSAPIRDARSPSRRSTQRPFPPARSGQSASRSPSTRSRDSVGATRSGRARGASSPSFARAPIAAWSSASKRAVAADQAPRSVLC